MYIITIGIDTGVSGAITLMHNGEAIQSQLMPTLKVKKGKGTKTVIDEDGLLNMFCTFDEPMRQITCIIEDVHAMPSQGSVSGFTFGFTYGVIKMAAVSMGWDVRCVSPRVWKNQILKDYPRGKDKKSEKLRSVRYCLEHHNYHDLIPKGRKIHHDGVADSLCLAEYGYRLRRSEALL